MTITYCEQWSRNYLYPHKPLTEQQAEARHREAHLYTALLGDPARPHCFLEFSEHRSVCVEFLDDALRPCRVYSFSEQKPQELFVEKAVIRRYEHAIGHESDGHVYYFKIDGRLFVEHYRVGPHDPSVLTSSKELRIDITHNWERFPEFGNYEGLAHMNRGIAMIDA